MSVQNHFFSQMNWSADSRKAKKPYYDKEYSYNFTYLKLDTCRMDSDECCAHGKILTTTCLRIQTCQNNQYFSPIWFNASLHAGF